MSASLYFVSFLLFLEGCMGFCGNFFDLRPWSSAPRRIKPKFNIDDYNYEGDPVGISCVFDRSMYQFHQENITGTSQISEALIERLTNTKPLSLYIDGIFSHIRPNGATFKFAKEWYMASKTNVCYLTYAFDETPNGVLKNLLYVRKLVKSHRLQYAAKVARDLVLNIRNRCIKMKGIDCWKNMSQVTVVGFSLGAHVAAQTCINLYESTGEKVGKLIGVDPAGIDLTLRHYDQPFISRGDAAYVQIIHTDILIMGTPIQCGDVDIYVTDLPVGLGESHSFSAYVHMATAAKKLLMVAEKNGRGLVIPIRKYLNLKNRVPSEKEVFVGVYSEFEESKRGKRYFISLKNHVETLRHSLANFVKIRLR